jgi:hypothetical protein
MCIFAPVNEIRNKKARISAALLISNENGPPEAPGGPRESANRAA